MFEQFQICPYTGLRSFTEEESLYFKGREEDIDQATAQLQKNKFLMLTGASGDGKSSLIFAGIIPNARAGFLKAQYTNWCVANFRPERKPFSNLVRSLARQLDISDTQIVASELHHGFSALVDLYKNSKLYIDKDSLAWQSADEKGRAALKRDAANLIVLVDQFEEFFTNPENYQHGVPSRESNLVLNLLLETARIALEEDLPIYVVFTMRSDYIGQCAAFRGLPEYLGFSQYFVPRLNRSQLQQVIEEPAVLSGNRISRRLTERLIEDLTEGVDQLPILQHALNQIWVAADHGAAEMDLVHYAMVGGMSADELPDEDIARFRDWFQHLPPEIKQCYHKPSLQNVLDTHTNKLFEQAAGYYKTKSGQTISAPEAKDIVRKAFTCLTKIDQGRAVRNRMSLDEITRIIGLPGTDTKKVAQVLDIFREPGNTFIHPFISEHEPESQTLEAGQVLDITHESLIRNWKYLGDWAREEFDSRNISLDFEQQLGRWVNSGKSRDFLLSIGPLTYFESWFNKVKPNAWWIARYLPDDGNDEGRLVKAKQILSDAKEFLERSADKHFITRTVMRIGTRRIAASLGLIALITLTSFAVKNYLNKQNSAVMKSLKEEAVSLLGNPKVTITSKSFLALEMQKLGMMTAAETISGSNQILTQVNTSSGIASNLVLQGQDQPPEVIRAQLTLSDSLLESIPVKVGSADTTALILKEINDLRTVLELAGHFSADPALLELRRRNAQRSARWVMLVYNEKPSGFQDMIELTLAQENALNYKALEAVEIDTLIRMLSPFETPERDAWVEERFQKEKLMIRGEQGYGFAFNGLYQQLAYLYAAQGRTGRVIQCIDTLLKYNQSYFQGDYAGAADNATSILPVFLTYGYQDEADAFVSVYAKRKQVSREDVYLKQIGRSFAERATASSLDLFWWMNIKMNLNDRYADPGHLEYYFDKIREAIQDNPDPNHRSLQTALAWKNQGITRALLPGTVEEKSRRADSCFDLAVTWFRKVDPAYLSQPDKIIGIGSNEELLTNRKHLFIYPDLRLNFMPFEPRAFFHSYYTDIFLDYILKKGLFDTFYTDPESFKVISEWLMNYNTRMFAPIAFLVKSARYEVLQKLAAALERRSAEYSYDHNLLYLYLGYEAQKKGEVEKMLAYYKKLQPNNFLNLLRTKEYANNVNTQAFRMMGFAVKGLMEAGKFEEAQRLISVFKKPANRSSLYSFVATEIMLQRKDPALASRLIDSARAEVNRTGGIQNVQVNRLALTYALALQNASANKEEIDRLIKNLPQKLLAYGNAARAMAFRDKMFDARAAIPELVSDDDRAASLWRIYFGYSQAQPSPPAAWQRFHESYSPFPTRIINYEDESS